jgi:pyruvate/2-oxoglutarate dehydrogenase complex dihydrolipoamide dehydrogenase (E3) component
MPKYDLIVLGGGSAGLATARRARQSGATVALIEKDILGGECPNSACVPAKALLRSAAAIVEVRRAAEFGIRVDQPCADWPAVRERMLGIIGHAEGDAPTEEKLRAQGIEVFRGRAFSLRLIRFVSMAKP